jgi:hypothetical protein
VGFQNTPARAGLERLASHCPDSLHRQQDNRLQEVKDAMDRNSDQAEGEQTEPDDGIQNQGSQCQGPADNKQQTPKYESKHVRTCPGYENSEPHVPRKRQTGISMLG